MTLIKLNKMKGLGKKSSVSTSGLYKVLWDYAFKDRKKNGSILIKHILETYSISLMGRFS